MREALNPNTLFATVAMYIQESHSLLLVVEGPDDHEALKNHCSPDLSLMPGTGGRAQVLGAANLANTRGLKGVRFLIDRDYDAYSGDPDSGHLPNVFVSQHHDLFMDLIVAEPVALHRVIDAHTRAARRRTSQGEKRTIPDATKIEEDALMLASQLAAVRVVNTRMGVGLDFTRFSFGSLKYEELEVATIARAVCLRSRLVVDSVETVVDQAQQVATSVGRSPYIVGDHDLFSAVSCVLRNYEVKVSAAILLTAFLTTFTCVAVSALSWFSDIQEWAAQNKRAGMTCGIS